MIKLLSLFIAFTAQAAPESGAWKCQDGKIRTGKAATQSSFCHRRELKELLSKNCMSGNCELLKRIRKAERKLFTVELDGFGNPDYRICRRLGGVPRSVEISEGGTWKTQIECRIGKDQSFASIGLLQQAARRFHPGSLESN